MGRRRHRDIRLVLDDGFRGGITVGVATLAIIILTMATTGAPDSERTRLLIIATCAGYTGALLVYLVWTHLLFTRIPQPEAERIARWQYHQRPPRWTRLFSFGSSEGWAISAALLAFAGSIAAAVYGVSGGVVAVTAAALSMAATAWATVVYTYALRYLRLHSAGETFSSSSTTPRGSPTSSRSR